jgi:hypothetical protein
MLVVGAYSLAKHQGTACRLLAHTTAMNPQQLDVQSVVALHRRQLLKYTYKLACKLLCEGRNA